MIHSSIHLSRALVSFILFGSLSLVAVPVRAEAEVPVGLDAPVVVEVQAAAQPTEDRRETPATVAQTPPAANAEPVSTRVPLGSRIFAAPSMQQ